MAFRRKGQDQNGLREAGSGGLHGADFCRYPSRQVMTWAQTGGGRGGRRWPEGYLEGGFTRTGGWMWGGGEEKEAPIGEFPGLGLHQPGGPLSESESTGKQAD